MNTTLDLLQKALQGHPDAIPAGFKTTLQYSKEWELPERSTLGKLQAGVRMGVVEVRKFRIQNGQSLRPVPHYKINLKKK